MEVIFILIAVSLVVAILFLFLFLRSAQMNQFDDLETPAMRILFDEKTDKTTQNEC